jgi:hypothetical protein
MKLSILLATFLVLPGANSVKHSVTAPIKGDYVEARTVAVFAGACHYNGESMIGGRDAVLAWNVASGSFNGVDLAGVRAVAVVTATDNLAEQSAVRHCEITIDSGATKAQADAMAAALESRFGKTLGQVKSVRSGAVSFSHVDSEYKVDAKGFATMDVQSMPNDECCKQPNLVWYSPLIPVEGRKVGYVVNADYSAGTLTDTWQEAAENAAFYGPFSF